MFQPVLTSIRGRRRAMRLVRACAHHFEIPKWCLTAQIDMRPENIAQCWQVKGGIYTIFYNREAHNNAFTTWQLDDESSIRMMLPAVECRDLKFFLEGALAIAVQRKRISTRLLAIDTREDM